MSEQGTYVTREGLKSLENELDHLRRVRRPEVAHRLQEAIDEGGDLRENAEYEQAKEEQSFVEGRILELETMLSEAIIIEDDPRSNGVVRIGHTVRIVEVGTDDVETYQIVGAAEANPTDGRISNESPLGEALIGKKKGQKVTVHSPAGDIEFEIVEIVS